MEFWAAANTAGSFAATSSMSFWRAFGIRRQRENRSLTRRHRVISRVIDEQFDSRCEIEHMLTVEAPTELGERGITVIG